MSQATPPPARDAVADALRSSYRVLQGLLGLVVVGYLLSGIYVVEQHEVAVELRFGRLVGDGRQAVNRAGLHLAWPQPIGEVIKVPIGRVQSRVVNDFWYHETARERATERQEEVAETLRPGRDGYFLTGDQNILHARWTVNYRVVDPAAWLFGCSEPEQLLDSALAQAVCRVAARSSTTAVWREAQDVFRREVLDDLRRRCAGLGLGVELVDLLLEEDRVMPPRQTAPAFADTLRASQDARRLVSEAEAEAARRLAGARGEAAATVSRARSDATGYVGAVAADAELFTALLEQYQADPQGTRRRRWREAVTAAVGAAGERVVVPSGERVWVRAGRPPKVRAPQAADESSP